MNNNAPYFSPDMFDIGRQEIGNDFKLWRVIEKNGKKVWIHETDYIDRLKQKILEKEKEKLKHLKKADNMLDVMLNEARQNQNKIQKEKEELLKKHENKCPPGKEVNPKTGRCIKMKLRSGTVKKECPPGKVVNPKTGRCIKMKLRSENSKKEASTEVWNVIRDGVMLAHTYKDPRTGKLTAPPAGTPPAPKQYVEHTWPPRGRPSSTPTTRRRGTLRAAAVAGHPRRKRAR